FCVSLSFRRLYLLLHLSHFLSVLFFIILPPPRSTLFPYTTLFRSLVLDKVRVEEVALSIADRSHAAPLDVDVERSGVTSVGDGQDRKSTRLNSSHQIISYAVFCLKKKKKITTPLNQSTNTKTQADN